MKVMVSACLLGDNVKYNGENNFHENLVRFLKDYEVVKVCPECLGGLSIPRDPCEVVNDKVVNQKGVDVTKEFSLGALKTLEIAKKENIHVVILKKNSPSCGSKQIYDGTFSHHLIDGMGITAKLLSENNIVVLDEDNYKEYVW